MPIHTLPRRWRTGELARVESDTPAHAVERVAEARMSLAYADLKGLDAPRRRLPGVDLRGADLEAANLSHTDLERADLRTAVLVSADLRGTSLRRADLRRANARNADLRGCDLRDSDLAGAGLRDAIATGARLDGARLDWRSSTFVVELLRCDAGARDDANRLVLDLAFSTDERPYAWLETVARRPALIVWVASVIGRAARPGDGLPEVLRRLSADLLPNAPSKDDAGTPSAGFYWTRATHPGRAGRRSPSQPPDRRA